MTIPLTQPNFCRYIHTEVYNRTTRHSESDAILPFSWFTSRSAACTGTSYHELLWRARCPQVQRRVRARRYRRNCVSRELSRHFETEHCSNRKGRMAVYLQIQPDEAECGQEPLQRVPTACWRPSPFCSVAEREGWRTGRRLVERSQLPGSS